MSDIGEDVPKRNASNGRFWGDWIVSVPMKSGEHAVIGFSRWIMLYLKRGLG